MPLCDAIRIGIVLLMNGGLLMSTLPVSASPGTNAAAAAPHQTGFNVVTQEVFVSSPTSGVGVLAASYYTRQTGGDLISLHHYISRSDILHDGYARLSTDNGRHWGEPVQWSPQFTHPKGKGQRDTYIGFADPGTGRFVLLWNEAVLASDSYTECMRNGTICYKVSQDGGRTWTAPEQIIHEGPGYDAIHHLPGVTVGTNCVMFGDLTCRPLARKDGVILVPVQSSPPSVSVILRRTDVYTFTD